MATFTSRPNASNTYRNISTDSLFIIPCQSMHYWQLKIFAQLLFWKISDIIEKLEEWQTSICSSLAFMLSRFSHVQLFATLWTVAYQAPLSMRFSRKEYWSGLPCPPPGDLPDPGVELMSLTSPELAGKFFVTITTWEALALHLYPSNANIWPHLLCHTLYTYHTHAHRHAQTHTLHCWAIWK